MRKKTVSIILVLCLLIGSLSGCSMKNTKINAENAESHGVFESELEWYYKGGDLVVQGWGKLLFPAFTTVNENIRTITIEGGCSEIGQFAFLGADPVKIKISNSVHIIYTSAFTKCNSLVSVEWNEVEYTSRSELFKAMSQDGVAVIDDLGKYDVAVGDDDARDGIEPVRIEVYDSGTYQDGLLEGWLAQVLREKFNVELCVHTGGMGSRAFASVTRYGYDIIIWNEEAYLEAVKEDRLYDWETRELLHHNAPYIEEHMSEALEANRELSGGSIYGLAGNVAYPGDLAKAQYQWAIRWDLYKELGYPQYNTLEEFADVLEAMRELYPINETGEETYAIATERDSVWGVADNVRNLAEAYYGNRWFGFGMFDPESGHFEGALEESSMYLECLRFYNDLHQRGLLETEMTDNDLTDIKIETGRYMCALQSGIIVDGIYNDNYAENNMQMFPWLPMNAKVLVRELDTNGRRYIWSIDDNTRNAVLCMQILNWLATPEGRMTCEYGPQGLCWDYNEEGHLYLTEFGQEVYEDIYTEMIGEYEGTGDFYTGRFPLSYEVWDINASNPDSNGDTYNYEYWTTTQKEVRCATEEDWQAMADASNAQEYIIESGRYVMLPYTDYEQVTDTPEEYVVLRDILVEYTEKAMYAESDEAFEQVVEEMRAQAQANGYDELIAWCEEEAEYYWKCIEEALEGRE